MQTASLLGAVKQTLPVALRGRHQLGASIANCTQLAVLCADNTVLAGASVYW